MKFNTLLKLSVSALFVIGLAGCESSPSAYGGTITETPKQEKQWTKQTLENAKYLKVGMSEQQVIEIMGEPIHRDFRVERSALQWCTTGDSINTPYDRFLVAFFTNEILDEIRNYTNKDDNQVGDCSTLYREVEWIDPANKVIEIRERNMNQYY